MPSWNYATWMCCTLNKNIEATAHAEYSLDCGCASFIAITKLKLQPVSRLPKIKE
jgi:hypothetical protein